VVFVLLMYSLLQWYWQRIRRPEFNPRTTARALDQLRPTMTVILIFYQGYVARLAPLEYQELLLTLKEEARLKILAKTRGLRRGLSHRSITLALLRLTTYPAALRKSIAPSGKGYAFFCRASLSLSRLVRSAPRPSLLPRTGSSLMKPIAQPEGPRPFALLPLNVGTAEFESPITTFPDKME
jgi:hypothetical protein